MPRKITSIHYYTGIVMPPYGVYPYATVSVNILSQEIKDLILQHNEQLPEFVFIPNSTPRYDCVYFRMGETLYSCVMITYT